MGKEEEIIQFLRYVGFDYVEEDESIDTWPECEDQADDGCCPPDANCGRCRFEYMKKKGWLSDGRVD